MKKPELLSPAGDMDCLVAAISAGSDAIYIASKNYGARAFAHNFSLEQLKEATDLCHLYGVKLYVAANTLIYEKEVEDFLDYMRYLCKIGVDAVIMQDIGMIDLVRKVLPDLEIHASTQCHIHNLSSVKFMENLGVSRVVVAREVAVNEIKNIKANTNIELECFVHGALCISYSGQCLMSSLIGSRSGNRGACAGPCRLKYDLVDENGKIINEDKYLLSMKDLNSLENIGFLIDIGVDSFKIEGRMKSPSYVYAVTKLYRQAIDSYMKYHEVRISNQDIIDLKKIFNREFTKGHLFSEDNNNLVNQYRPNHLGVLLGKVIDVNKSFITLKLDDDILIGDGIRIIGDNDIGLTVTSIYKNNHRVEMAKKNDIISLRVSDSIKKGSRVVKTTDKLLLKSIDDKIRQKMRKVKIKMQVKLRVDNPIILKVKDGNNTIIKEYGNVSNAIKSPIKKEDIIKCLNKLGDTVYEVEDLIIKMDDNIFVNLKDLNEIRRQAIELLNIARMKVKPYRSGEYNIEVDNYPRLRNRNVLIEDDDMYLKVKDSYDKVYTNNLALYHKYPDTIYMLPRVIEDYPLINSEVAVEELGGIMMYQKFSTGAFLNVCNSYSLALLHSMGADKVTLSYELNKEDIASIISSYEKRYHKHPNVEIIVYGPIEAMISKYNLLKKYNVCGNYYLLDRFKNKYPIKIHNDKMIIYNYKVRDDKNNYFDIGVNNIRYDIVCTSYFKENNW